jgi:hypothetical protein
MNVDDYIEYTIDVDRGFKHRVQARVTQVFRGGWGMCRPFSVYVYHPDHPERGAYVPPAKLLAFSSKDVKVMEQAK